MKVIFALGNHGARYSNTRHNTGWMILDSYSQRNNLSFTHKAKFHAYIAELLAGGDKNLLVKPTTYYNEVGRSARVIADFYKLDPSDFLIIHDDLAIDQGKVRVRQGGSDAGNNGIKSLNTHLGADSWRLRIGTKQNDPEEINDKDIVLGLMTKEEALTLSEVIPSIHQLIDQFISGDLDAMTLQRSRHHDDDCHPRGYAV